MPKLRDNQVPSYRLHKRSGQAVVTLGGRNILLGTHESAASKAKYRVTRNGLPPKASRKRGTGDGLTVVEVVLAFWRYAKAYYRNDRICPLGLL